jgi:acetyltransferase-like isoleucine patch superfamily enzyme
MGGLAVGGIRSALKWAAHATATVLVTPMVVSFHVRARLIGGRRALSGSTQFLALMPGLIGQYLRRAFLGCVLAHCDRECAIEFGSIFSDPGARIDAGAYIGPYSHIGLVHIQRDALLGAGVHVPSGPLTHGFADITRPIREQPGTPQLVTIGAGSWVGSGAIVLADVGADTIVAAGAVVTRPLPDRVIAGGVPATVLRSRVAVPVAR